MGRWGVFLRWVKGGSGEPLPGWKGPPRDVVLRWDDRVRKILLAGCGQNLDMWRLSDL